MSHVNAVRAWKDEEYRLSLTDAERAALPENPAGLAELAETELPGVAGGLYWGPPIFNPSWIDACPSWFCGPFYLP
jgi:mersacidin/lichenicidin family type 2 lantibiotic